jgi:hypothetical protein
MAVPTVKPRFPTDASDPWQNLSERLDHEFEKWPARERPQVPPVPSFTHVPGAEDDARTASAVPLALALAHPAPAPLETAPPSARGRGTTPNLETRCC